MNVLVVNDDGIEAAGIRALVEALSKVADVYVSAPHDQQSGKSQSLTIRKDMIVKEVEFPGAVKAYRVGGTPADCTKLGLQLCEKAGIKIDMVFTGINMGSNLGIDTVYSGTVGSAMEAAIDGYHAVAVSVDSHEASYFEYACALALEAIDFAQKNLPPSIVLNINTPNLPKEEIKGVRFTVLGHRYYDDEFVKIGESTYRLEGEEPNADGLEPNCDIKANLDGYASVTPLSYNYTAEKYLDKVKEWSIKL